MAQRNKKLIYHIYWGTAGNAGLYLDEIYKVLEKAGYQQKAFVNYYYPFDYGDKVFYRYTELGHSQLKKFRMPVRFWEMLCAFLFITIETIIDRPQIINYSLVGSYAPIRWYLLFAKKIMHCKIVITCHDVIPSFSGESNRMDEEMAIRQRIFDHADYLLVHTENSLLELKDTFNQSKEKTLYHLFPIMDLTRIPGLIIKESLEKSDFLFLGHIRREKGVDLLLEAWEIFHQRHPNAKLRIAGNLPKTESIDVDKYEGREDVDFILKFLSDEEYCRLIKSTRYVVMPYKHGTNSGVVSTVLSLNVDVIASDIPMFTENTLIDKTLLFETEKSESLVKKMEYAIEKSEKGNRASLTIMQYREEFTREVVEVYGKIATCK